MRSGRDWRPAMMTWCASRLPPVGSLIGLDYKIWRVVGIVDVNPGNWSEKAAQRWVAAGRPEPWREVPTHVSVVPAEGGKRHGITIEPWHYTSWNLVPEHYPICVKCHEPAPCREHVDYLQARAEMRLMEERMKVPDGCCPACREPITTRQKSHCFPGPNLLNALGRDGVVFHARGKCWQSAAHYENLWVAADPTRKRSLLTLRCSGTVVTHADGTGECFGATDADCPNIYAFHDSRTACWAQSHGCPKGCPKEGHPGITLARNLNRYGQAAP